MSPWDGPVAAALLLQEPGLPGGVLVAATLKELVLRGGVRIEARPRKPLLGVRRRPRYVLRPGALPPSAPAALSHVHGRLDDVEPDPGGGLAVRAVGRRFGELRVGEEVLGAVRDDLLTRGLLEPGPRRFGARPDVRTAAGEAMLAQVLARTEPLHSVVAERRKRDPEVIASAVAALAAAGTLAVIIPGAVDELALGWAAWRRRAGADGGNGTPAPTVAVDPGSVDVGRWAALDELPTGVLDALGEHFARLETTLGSAAGGVDALARGGYSGFDGAVGNGLQWGFDGRGGTGSDVGVTDGGSGDGGGGGGDGGGGGGD